MNVDAIAFLAPVQEPSLLPAAAPAAAPDGKFGAWFAQQLSQVNTQLVSADHGVQALAAGEAVNLHEVMIDLEQAKMSLQLLAQVRTRLLEGYQEILRMQV